VDAVQVRRGDRLYFRVQSILDGQFDEVAWNPDINYVGVSAGTDVNGLDHYRLLASRDFTIGGRPSVVTVPTTGTACRRPPPGLATTPLGGPRSAIT
jgi:hypothetical protein